MLTQAVLLAGGLGTRLGTLTRDLPKPMVDVGGQPFLELLVRHIAGFGCDEIAIVTGHRHEVIADRFEGRRFGDTRVRLLREETPAGTGGFLRLFESELHERFLLMNADTLLDLNHLDLMRSHVSTGALVTVALREVEDAGRYGSVEVEGARLTSFHEKREGDGRGWINGGVYAVERQVAARVGQPPVSFERDVLPALTAEGRVGAFPTDGFFIDIGLPETLADAQTTIPNWWRRPAAFLDRDGVLNRDPGYVHRREDWEWMPGAREAIRALNDAGYRVFVVSNQAGIGRGLYSTEDFQALMRWVRADLQRDGARIDAVYHCPHHAEHGVGDYRRACDSRKPGSGMLRQAMSDFATDRERSFLVGDRDTDIMAAADVGIRGVLVEDCHDLLAVIREQLAGSTDSAHHHAQEAR